MKYAVIHGQELTVALVARWVETQESRQEFANPYFRPEFTQAVATVRDDVRIGLLEDDGKIVGFFPFHRGRGGAGRPIGLGLSDYHAVIADTDAHWSIEELLRGVGLVRYDFDHLLTGQKQFESHYRGMGESPVLDLSGGYEAFAASRDKAGRKQLREIERKRERIEAEIGPLRFVNHSQDEVALRTVMEWKSEQCRETGTVDYFAIAWCRELVQRIHRSQSAGFSGVLSCLYAGDTLAAAHFAMRSERVCHSWFPVYNHQLESYSPGMILLVEMVRAAATSGISYIDFGKGVSTYKRRFMTGTIRVAEGSVELPSLGNTVRHWRSYAEQWGRNSMLRPILLLPARVIGRIERNKRYR